MLNQLKVNTRLMALSLFPLLVLTVSYVIAIKDMRQLSLNTDSLYHDRVVPLRDLKVVADSYAVAVVDAFQKYRAEILTQDQLRAELNTASSQGTEAWARFMTTYMDAEEQRLANLVNQHLGSAQRLIQELLQSADRGELRSMDAKQFNTRLFEAFDPLSDAINALTDLQLTEASQLRHAAERQYMRDRNLFIVMGFMAVILTGLIAWRISASIQGPINRILQTITAIGRDSDLTLRTQVEGSDEFAVLGKAFNQLIGHFQQLINNLASASEQLAAAAEEMSAISTQVSGSARHQEDQTTMIATAINQMTAAISEVATHAQSASSSADQANEQAGQGLTRTRQSIKMIEALAHNIHQSANRIAELDTQAEQISEVLDVIESIAEQTNLLALNAAIEAARAGDAGRGFAVVADEVRSLAASTRQSTERIQDSISKLQSVAKEAVKQMQASNQAAQQGVENAKINGETFETVSGAVGAIVDMNVHISSATEEQTAVANDINENIHQVVKTVGEVVEGAEQTSLASQQLSELAQQLRHQVDQFRI
ncbi:MAG: methyl-accepting chemotaxis protein [Nitrincola lacisaponensis]